MKKRLKDIPWYPIIISVYPALTLFNANLSETRIESVQRSIVASAALGGLLYLALWVILGGVKQAAFLALLWQALFYTFGHVNLLLADRYPQGGFEVWLILTWSLLLGLSILLARQPPESAPLNAAGILLALLPLAQSAVGQGQGWGNLQAPDVTGLRAPANPPDVYYFIFDSYGRADALQAAYGYDNSEFVEGLRERGFYVAECSQSNYTRTELSLASSLNMSYLQQLDAGYREGGQTPRRALWDAIQHSAVRQGFERMGYKSVGFATGFPWSEMRDADAYYKPAETFWELNEFEYLFLRTTALQPGRYIANERARERFEQVFERLGEIAEMEEATFAYIHIIPPHPPFVYDAAGNAVDEDLPYAEGYLGQLAWLNQKALEAADSLLAKSETAPIIVMQGDHGAAWAPQILNAYHLPAGAGGLYADITPVNSFRLIFNAYYGGAYPLLEDATYDSVSALPLYEFAEIANECEGRK